MNDRLRQQWEALGEYDPYWAVQSDPTKRGGKWQKDKDRFFQLGTVEISSVLNHLAVLQIKHGRGVALDFGCGVGRLSRALAGHFERVLAFDISRSMLAEAQSANAQYKTIEFWHNTEDNLRIVPSETVDFLYTNLVLQHMPPKRQQPFIREFCRVLKTGGALVFQTPSRPQLKNIRGWVHLLAGNRLLNLVRTVRYGKAGVIEMHTLSREKVLETLEEQRMTVVEIVEEGSSGPAFVGYMYFATKPNLERRMGALKRPS